MSARTANTSALGIRSFDLIKNSMLQSDEMPLAEALDMDQWQTAFDDHEIDFGSDENAIYTPAITLWAVISQVFFKGEMRSCKAAVCRIATLWATLGKTVCSTNTGAYCRARSKIAWEAVRDICCQIAESAEASFDHQQTELQDNPHDVVAEAQSTPIGGRILLVDGFTTLGREFSVVGRVNGHGKSEQLVEETQASTFGQSDLSVSN